MKLGVASAAFGVFMAARVGPGSALSLNHDGVVKSVHRVNSNGAVDDNVPKAAEEMTRRDVWKALLSSSAAAVAAIATVPNPSNAAEQTTLDSTLPSLTLAESSARVATWPGIEYLEPIYELKLSVEALAQASSDTARYPVVRQRLEQFFKGKIVSEKNYYIGLSVQYNRKIKYERKESRDNIKADRSARNDAMNETMKALELLLGALQDDNMSKKEQQRQVSSFSEAAKKNLDGWFATVPSSDVERAGKLFVATRQADANRNGQLEDDELATLSDEDRDLWKKRVKLVGE